MQISDLITIGIIGIVIFAVSLIKLRDYCYNKNQAENNWAIACCRRECWVNKNPNKDWYLTPQGQWLIRVEAGAHKLWLLKKFWLTKKDKEQEGWYANLVDPELFAENPLENQSHGH